MYLPNLRVGTYTVTLSKVDTYKHLLIQIANYNDASHHHRIKTPRAAPIAAVINYIHHIKRSILPISIIPDSKLYITIVDLIPNVYPVFCRFIKVTVGPKDQDSQTTESITQFTPILHDIAYRNKFPHRCREFLCVDESKMQLLPRNNVSMGKIRCRVRPRVRRTSCTKLAPQGSQIDCGGTELTSRR